MKRCKTKSLSIKNNHLSDGQFNLSPRITRKITVVDTTLRDGSHAIRHSYTPEQVAAIAGGLDKAHKILVGFDKTELLQPSEKETIKANKVASEKTEM